jgi:hypothetical protein
MSGIAVVLGGNQSPHATYVQVAGEGQRITAKELRNAMSASGTLHALLLKYVQVFMVQTAHTAIANARAHIDQRLARWILMAHDRTGENTLPLTHEFLALMLGVRRAGVTEALQSLKRQKLIHNGRNEITLLNRKLIERMAGNSYGVIDVLSADAALYDSARFRLEEPGSYLPTGACGIIEVFIFFGVGRQDL